MLVVGTPAPHPRPRSWSRRVAIVYWNCGGGGADHHNLTAAYLRPPSPEKTPPGPTALAAGGNGAPGRSGAGRGLGDARGRRSRQDLPPAPAATAPGPGESRACVRWTGGLIPLKDGNRDLQYVWFAGR